MNKPGFPHKYLSKVVSEKTRLSNIRAGICHHWGCARSARKDGRDCNTCKCRKARMRHPLKYAFNNVRDCARQRKVPFLLSLEEFKAFCQRTGYLTKKGREFEDLTIDRIDPSKPYQADNIRTLTWIDNSSHKLENMKDPVEPIARAIAKAKDGGEKFWSAHLEEARRVLAQVEALQESLKIIDTDPF